MSYRRLPPSGALVQRLTELSLAAPEVMTHRLLRMAAAGHNPGAHDRREFHLMGLEKVAAFYESWNAMGFALWRAQQELALSWMSLWWGPFLGGGGPAMSRMRAQWRRAAVAVAHAGLRPVHRRAVANARRLRKRV